MSERQPVRDDLCRSVTFKSRDSDEPNDGFTLDGYGAVFNSPTRIDSWEGCFNETIAPGAFRKSLKERTPRMQFDHGHHPLIGSIPIGRFTTVDEDTTGLHVIGRLSDNWLIEPVRQAIAEGGIDGMSFRFSVVREEWRDKDGKLIKSDDELWEAIYNGSRDDAEMVTRTLKELRVTEVGPVVWPAYEDTKVGMRSKSFTVDLGSRESLARAAFVIDAAVRNTGNVGEVVFDRTKNDAPPSTEVEAVEHSEEPPDTSTEAGEHPSEEIDARHERAKRLREMNRGPASVLSGIKKGDQYA